MVEEQKEYLGRANRHSLMNIFSIIYGNAEMLLDELELNDADKRKIERILEASEKGEQLVRFIRNENFSHIKEQIESTTLQGKILLLDDDDGVVNIAAKILTKLGLEVVCENNPKQAYQVFIQDPDSFDLIITDNNMPEITGEELGHSIRAIRDDIPLVMITGDGQESEFIKNIEKGETMFSKVLFKPFKSANLINTVASLIKG